MTGGRSSGNRTSTHLPHDHLIFVPVTGNSNAVTNFALSNGASYNKIIAETPDYFVFNGAVGALSEKKPLTSKVRESVRIFFGDAGPNKASAFHAIGQIFERDLTDPAHPAEGGRFKPETLPWVATEDPALSGKVLVRYKASTVYLF